MTKTYEINGKEIDVGDTLDYIRFSEVEKYILKQLLEALSDKEEKLWDSKEGQTNYCPRCERDSRGVKTGMKHTCGKEEPNPSNSMVVEQKKWKGCGICNCKYPQFCEGCYKADYKCRVCDKEQKQSTSLKESLGRQIQEISGWMLDRVGGLVEADKILSLIQSHLVKEIIEKVDAKYDDGNEKTHPEKAYFECKQDIIKIINNLTK